MGRPDHTVDGLQSVQDQLTTVLAGWAVVSVLAGSSLLLGQRDHQQRRAFGRQTVAWGAINGAIAAVGRRRRRTPADPARAATRLRRVLLGNAVLDVGYLAAGAALIRYADRLGSRRRYTAAAARGDGAAIVVQSVVLLVLDVTFARRLPAPGLHQAG